MDEESGAGRGRGRGRGRGVRGVRGGLGYDTGRGSARGIYGARGGLGYDAGRGTGRGFGHNVGYGGTSGTHVALFDSDSSSASGSDSDEEFAEFQKVGIFERYLTLLHLEKPKLYTILVFLSAVGSKLQKSRF